MNHIRQINLLIKRILCRPAMIVVLLVIPAVLIAVSFLPARKQSTEIVSGVYIESSDEHTDAFLSYLTSTSTGFTFRHYESPKDMKDDVASGRIDSAYMVPDGFSESMIHSDGKRHITVYTTDGSSFQSVSEESVYAALLYAYAADMSVCMLQDRYLANVPYDETQMSEYISDRFKGYIENEDIFTIESGLTGKYTAIPCFIGIMGLVFFLTFGVIGAFLQNILEVSIDALGGLVDQWMGAANVNSVLRSLVMDGIFTGVGSVLSFLPIIVTLFFFLSMLEDSGYMARVAFIMDKLLRKMGLSGRSIVPLLVGFGCTVPGVMASRTLPSERDRKMTILLTPFMSCSAKLPIYAFFAAAFFPKHGALVMIVLYFGGILMGILMALVFRGTLFKGNAVPFVMELPNYRMPGAKNVGHLLWDKAKDFLQRAFTVIFMATLVIWFLQTFDGHLNIVSDSQESILAMVASVIAPVFAPMGFGDWRISTALITGFMAKESVVSTLSVLFGQTSALLGCITPVSAASLLVFCLLYTPCVAAIASIKRELGSKWAVGVVIGQCVIAWVAAFVVYLVGSVL